MSGSWSRRERLQFLLAVLLYLCASVLLLRSVLPDPYRLLPYNAGIDETSRQLGHFDQSMVVSTITRNAETILTEPWNLLGDGQCYPFPRSFTLGEHMFGEGLQMALPWLFTRDPILAYNVMLALTLWIPGITMYLLAFHFTRHASASFVAGLVFQLAPARIIDGGHPYLHAEFWIPLIVLFLHRLFTTDRRWTSAAAIALFLSLEALETIYVLLASILIASIYGLHLVLRYRRTLPRIALPLALAVGASAAVGWAILGPYLETRATWGLSSRDSLLVDLPIFGMGSPYFPGWLALVLIALGLLDRIRRRREVGGDDPRIPMLLAGLCVLWAAVSGVPIPGTGWALPGLLRLLGWVPGLDAVRGLFAVCIGLTVPVSFLSGYGALVLLERLKGAPSVAGVALLSAAIVAERAIPSVTLPSFGSPLYLEAWEARPAEEDLDLIRTVKAPVADVYMPEDVTSRMGLSQYLLLESWNPGPSSSCYNSFDTPLANQIFQLSGHLPSVSAAEALAALGFKTVLSHTEAWWPPRLVRWKLRMRADPRLSRVMRPAGETPRLTAYLLQPENPVREDFSILTGRALGDPVELEAAADLPGALRVPFVLRNPGPGTFRFPAPIAPRDGVLRWYRAGSAVGTPERVRVLWPIALGQGDIMRIDVISKAPPDPGRYLATVASADDPERVVATREVIVPDVEVGADRP